MPDYNVQVIVPGSQSTTVELPGIAGPPGPQGPVGPAGVFNTGLLDLRYVTLTGNQTVSGLKYFVQDNIIYTTNPLTDPYTSLIIDYSYINNLFLKPVPEYRPVVSPNPNYLYTGIDGGTESQMYFDTGESRWKFYYGGLNPIHLVAQSPIIKAGNPITFAAQVPMNGWTSSTGSALVDFRLHYTTLHKSSHQIGGKDYLDPDTINAVAKTGNQTISGVKNFITRPTVNGTGVLLSGEAAGLPNTLVYTTGNQLISGTKTFDSPIVFSSGIAINNIPGAGGSINLRGGDGDSQLGGAGGSISLVGSTLDGSAGSLISNGGAFGTGGTLDMSGGSDTNGGSITTTGGGLAGGHGGSIDTSAVAGEPGGNITSRGDFGGAGGSLNMSANIDFPGGSIDLSANDGANFSIQTGNLPAQNDGSIYNKINDALYIRKFGVWEKAITNADNPVYTTGNQTINGLKTFTNNINVLGTGILDGLDLNNVDNLIISGIDIYIENGNVSLTNTPTVRGNPVLTGVDLTQYATISNLNLTGANLNNKINTLSGVSVLTYGNQGIYGVKTFYDDVFMNNFTAYGTGTIVNTATSNIDSNYLILNITGGAIAGGIFFVTGTQGSGLGPIMGYDLSNNKFKIGTGSRNGGITTLDTIATENFVNTNAVLIYSNQSINGNKSFYGDVLLSGSNNRIGNSHYIQTDNNFVFIRNQNDTLIFGTEEYGLYDANGQITVAFNDRVLSGIDAASIYWGERYLANQLGQPVLYWTGDNIGIGTNNPSEKLEVAGNILGNNLVYNTGNQTISGIKTFASRPTVNGTGVLLSGEATVLPNTIVYITGNQTISGNKTFAQTGSFDTLQITNKKLSSYNYVNSNFIFGNTYINIVNSSNNIIGTLPSGITSGINYYVKNLNTGILLITGSSQRTIDGFSNINLYKNESLQLLGVNNVGYTGWVTLSADIGVS